MRAMHRCTVCFSFQFASTSIVNVQLGQGQYYENLFSRALHIWSRSAGHKKVPRTCAFVVTFRMCHYLLDVGTNDAYVELCGTERGNIFTHYAYKTPKMYTKVVITVYKISIILITISRGSQSE